MNSLFEPGASREVVPLHFLDVSMAVDGGAEEPRSEAPASVSPAAVDDERAGWEQRVARAAEAARAEAIAECEERMRGDLAVERSAVAHALTSFAQARARYFGDVEREVVKLSLAIAERVLQRESAMDPVLLEGVVKAALANVGDRDGAVLRVAVADAAMWQRAAKTAGIAVRADGALQAGDVLLDAAGGVAELGVRAQLAEIERGFFDLLAKRPA